MLREEAKQQLINGEIQIYFNDRDKLPLLKELIDYENIQGSHLFYIKDHPSYKSNPIFPFDDLEIIEITDIIE